VAVRVRYRPHDLGEAGVVERFEEANGFFVHDDNTLELRNRFDDEDGRPKYFVCGEVHPDRWDSVVLEDDDEQGGDDAA
jgi:hypothetical protein